MESRQPSASTAPPLALRSHLTRVFSSPRAADWWIFFWGEWSRVLSAHRPGTQPIAQGLQ